MPLRSVNPTTGKLITERDAHTPAQLRELVAGADKAFAGWRRAPFADRAAVLERCADLIVERKHALALLMASEMGKPIADGEAEADKCALVCRYYAEHAERYLAPTPLDTGARYSGVVYEPLGVVLAIMPWNYPLWQVFRALAPTLMAGNTMLLKHASNVSGCALAIGQLVTDAGAPDGVFSALLAPASAVADVIAAPQVRAVTLTGSTGAGRKVGALAGEHIKPCVLELGGSDPYIVLADADLDMAADKCVTSRMLNSGQSCIAAKRFVVVRSVVDEFTERVVERMSCVMVGDPKDQRTSCGPQARADLRDELHAQVVRSLGAGAKLALGGAVPDGAGAFYPPTVLTSVGPGSPAYQEELFGPVAAIIGADDERSAIRIANDTSFGLGAAVFTADVERGRRIAERELDAGCCAVNDFVRSHPHLPFGGIKTSGFGRELGEPGVRAFVNQKTIYVGG